MRPRKGVMECLRCSDQGKARTVLAKGKRINLGQGQVALGGRPQGRIDGVEPTLAPQRPTWTAHDGGTPHPQLGLFPHDEIREGQRRFARDATICVQQRRHLVAHAPTGIGKTAASLGPILEYALAESKVVFFLTSRQSQHHIAVETLRAIRDKRGAKFGLVDLVGKRDMCLRPEANEMHPARFPDFCARETREHKSGRGGCKYLGDPSNKLLKQVANKTLHVEELIHESKAVGLCPHLVAMEAAKHAHVVVADYNHLFSDIREQSLERLGVELKDAIVIVDEAHNLPDRIRRNHAHRITDFLLEQAKAEARKHRYTALMADLDALRECLINLADAAQREGRAQDARLDDGAVQVATLEIADLPEAFAKARNAGTLGGERTLEDLREDLAPLAKKVRATQDDQVFTEQLQEALEDWGRFADGGLRYVEWDDGGSISLHLRLLDPAVPARNVFDTVHSAILMSGTLRPPAMFQDLLGLRDDRTTVRDYPSPFPPENRALIVGTGMSTRFKERGPQLWSRIASTIEDVCMSTRGNLAIYAPSYRILQDVRDALPASIRKEHIIEEPGMSKGERDQVLDRLEGARRREGAILLGVMGGSFSEGVDFKDNLLSAVIVIGLPLAPPDLEVEATIAYLDRRFPGKGRLYGYSYPAMQKALQALGRGIRSGTDRCACLLLDERYLTRPYKALLPPESPPIATTDPGFTAASFLQAHGL